MKSLAGVVIGGGKQNYQNRKIRSPFFCVVMTALRALFSRPRPWNSEFKFPKEFQQETDVTTSQQPSFFSWLRFGKSGKRYIPFVSTRKSSQGCVKQTQLQS